MHSNQSPLLGNQILKKNFNKSNQTCWNKNLTTFPKLSIFICLDRIGGITGSRSLLQPSH